MFYINNYQNNILYKKKCIIKLIKIIHLGAKNSPVGWNGLNCSPSFYRLACKGNGQS